MTLPLTLAQLVAAGLQPTQARAFLDPLNARLPAAAITTPVRAAAFIGQAMIESASFTRLEEGLFYTDATRLWSVFKTKFSTPADASKYLRAPERLANRVYANRNGNGDEASGDGWRFRGRGLFQLTGRGNYQTAAKALGLPLVAQPELASLCDGAVATACWYWTSINANKFADDGLIDSITRRINGPAMLEARAREEAYRRALTALA